MEKKSIRMNGLDNVATALEAINSGEVINVITDQNEKIEKVKSMEKIPFGYKLALSDIKSDSYITKYGVNVAKATKDIKKGQLVHVHNAESMRVILPGSVRNEVMAEIGYQDN